MNGLFVNCEMNGLFVNCAIATAAAASTVAAGTLILEKRLATEGKKYEDVAKRVEKKAEDVFKTADDIRATASNTFGEICDLLLEQDKKLERQYARMEARDERLQEIESELYPKAERRRLNVEYAHSHTDE